MLEARFIFWKMGVYLEHVEFRIQFLVQEVVEEGGTASEAFCAASGSIYFLRITVRKLRSV